MSVETLLHPVGVRVGIRFGVRVGVGVGIGIGIGIGVGVGVGGEGFVRLVHSFIQMFRAKR